MISASSTNAAVAEAYASHRKAFRLGVGLFVLALAAGAIQSLRRQGSLPLPGHGYFADINVMLERGEPERALSAMRLAVELGIEDPSQAMSVLPTMARLAQRVGDREAELFALRRLAAMNPNDVQAHLRLVDVLLGNRDASPADLREAAGHAEMALQLAPRSAPVQFTCAHVHWRTGQPELAEASLRRAVLLDPAMGPQVDAARRAMRDGRS